jgi:hypothetical protein
LVKIIFIFSSSVSDEREDGFLVSEPADSFVRAGFFGGTGRGFGSNGGGGEDSPDEEVIGGDGVKDLGSSLLPDLDSPSGELLGEALGPML